MPAHPQPVAAARTAATGALFAALALRDRRGGRGRRSSRCG